jgi:hypothetical protein
MSPGEKGGRRQDSRAEWLRDNLNLCRIALPQLGQQLFEDHIRLVSTFFQRRAVSWACSYHFGCSPIFRGSVNFRGWRTLGVVYSN